MSKNFRKSMLAALAANTDLVAKVGSNISSSYAPKEFAGVWLVFTKVSGHEESANGGNQNFTERRFQFTVSSSDKTLVDDTAEILINEFNGFQFTAFPATGNEQTLTFFHEGDQETWEEPPRNYVATVDLRIQANT